MGRKRQKYKLPSEMAKKKSEKKAKSVNLPADIVDYLEQEAERSDAHFSTLVTEACEKYVEYLKRIKNQPN